MIKHPTSKKLACRNVLTALLNEALAIGIIGLTDGERPRNFGQEKRFRFNFSSREFEARIYNAAAGELRITAFLRGLATARKDFSLDDSPHPDVPLDHGFDAIFNGWLVRRDPPNADLGGYPRRHGAYLHMTSARCRRSCSWREFAQAVVEPGHDFIVKE